MSYILALIFFAFISSGSAWAFSLDDCIIEGMKGVSSNYAAKQIELACKRKHDEYERQRLQELEKEFGEVVKNDLVEATGYLRTEGAGFRSMEFTNKSTDKTVTYIRLAVIPALKDISCDSLLWQAQNLSLHSFYSPAEEGMRNKQARQDSSIRSLDEAYAGLEGPPGFVFRFSG